MGYLSLRSNGLNFIIFPKTNGHVGAFRIPKDWGKPKFSETRLGCWRWTWVAIFRKKHHEDVVHRLEDPHQVLEKGGIHRFFLLVIFRIAECSIPMTDPAGAGIYANIKGVCWWDLWHTIYSSTDPMGLITSPFNDWDSCKGRRFCQTARRCEWLTQWSWRENPGKKLGISPLPRWRNTWSATVSPGLNKTGMVNSCRELTATHQKATATTFPCPTKGRKSRKLFSSSDHRRPGRRW